MSKTIYIGGRLESKEKGNVVTGANAILDDTKGKKQNVINKETDDELLRLEQSKQDNLNFDNAPTENSTNPVTSGGVYTAEKALSDAIEAILLLIPSAATELNKLVDTNTMNSSISTATATFRGTYNAVSDLGLTYQATHAQIEAALDALGLTADNNDFAFVQIPVSDQSQDIAKTERFKFNGTNWLYEYDLNTSGFTDAQWAAINSGITVALVTKLTDLPTAAALQLALNAKQDTLTFDNEPTALSQNPVTSGGIYLAIQAVATALSNYSETTDGRLNTLEGLIPTEASSSNKLTDKAYVDGLIQAITELIPSEATSANQLADKAYVLAKILAATPAFKGQFVTLAELQAVASPKDGDLGIVRTKDSDGKDVFTFYQYLSNAWNVFYSLSYHPQTKPATTGTTGDYPYNGMGRVELAMNMVNTGTELAPVMVNQLTQDMFYKGAVGSRVPNTNTIFVIRYDYVLAENITIPDGCVLEFEGGSISGAYTFTGANTAIKADLVKIFDTTTTLAGTWNVAEVYPEWFGAKGNGTTDDSGVFAVLVSAPMYIIRLTKTYRFNSAVTFDKDRQLFFNKGSKFIPANDITITINGVFEAGLYTIFDFSLGGHIMMFWSPTDYNIVHFSGSSFTEKWNNLRHDLIQNRPYTLIVPKPTIDMEGVIWDETAGSNWRRCFWKIDGTVFINNAENMGTWMCYGRFSTVSVDEGYGSFTFGNLGGDNKPEWMKFPLGLFVGGVSGAPVIDVWSLSRFDCPVLDVAGGTYGLYLNSRTPEAFGEIHLGRIYANGQSVAGVAIIAENSHVGSDVTIDELKGEDLLSVDAKTLYIAGRVNNINIRNIIATASDPAYRVKYVVEIASGLETNHYAPNNITIDDIFADYCLVEDSENPENSIIVYAHQSLGNGGYTSNVSIKHINSLFTSVPPYALNLDRVSNSEFEYISTSCPVILNSTCYGAHIKFSGTVTDNGRFNLLGSCMKDTNDAVSDLNSKSGRIPGGTIVELGGGSTWIRRKVTGDYTQDYVQLQ